MPPTMPSILKAPPSLSILISHLLPCKLAFAANILHHVAKSDGNCFGPYIPWCLNRRLHSWPLFPSWNPHLEIPWISEHPGISLGGLFQGVEKWLEQVALLGFKFRGRFSVITIRRLARGEAAPSFHHRLTPILLSTRAMENTWHIDPFLFYHSHGRHN